MADRKHIFISYSHQDRDRVTELMRYLDQEKLPYWWDDKLSTGDEWRDVLQNAILNSFAVLVFLSDNAINSKFLPREWDVARRANIPIFLLAIRNRPQNFPPDLAQFNIAIIQNYGDLTWQRLVQSLRELQEEAALPVQQSPQERDSYEGRFDPQLGNTQDHIDPSQEANAPARSPRLQSKGTPPAARQRSISADKGDFEPDEIQEDIDTSQQANVPAPEPEPQVLDSLTLEATGVVGSPSPEPEPPPTDGSSAEIGNRIGAVNDPVAVEIGNRVGATSDVVTKEDQLGFNVYVQSFAELIMSPYTSLPLTIGIFGSWGIGKSFLLENIADEIANRQKRPSVKIEELAGWRYYVHPVRKFGAVTQARWRYSWQGIQWWWQGVQRGVGAFIGNLNQILFDKQYVPPTVEPRVSRVYIVKFNAWEYNATDIVWPGLVRKIMDTLEKEKRWWEFPSHFLLKLRRNFQYWWRKNTSKLFLMVIAITVLAVALVYWVNDVSVAMGTLLALGIGGILGLLKLITDTIATPLSDWITQLFEETDYGKRIGYMEEIRGDLEFLERRLRQANGRILIMVDDLDRCEPEKAVEMLQAIKLLLNFESFVVCMGIDARIITLAIGKFYQGLLEESGASGYEYLDKIVQIPFRIPEPEPENIEHFLELQLLGQLQSPPPTSDQQASETPAQTTVDKPTQTPTPQPETNQPAVTPQPEPTPPAFTLTDTAFTFHELNVFKKLADKGILKPNPRHLKRLFNVYRLVRLIAHYKRESRTMTYKEAVLTNPAVTIRWLVLCAQWPYTTAAMLRHFAQMEDEINAPMSKREKVKRKLLTKLPAVKHPILYLFDNVEPTLKPEKRDKLDFDPDLLRLLLNSPDIIISWGELKTLRQYTINFNPAVESEI